MMRSFIPSSSSRICVKASSASTSVFAATSLVSSFRAVHFRASKRAAEAAGTQPQSILDEKNLYVSGVHHDIWSEEECRAVRNDVRPRRNFTDFGAYYTIQLVRFWFDFLSGYMFGKLTTKKIFLRVLLLETAAGIPGQVAAALRTLKSLRTMERDYGWIQTLIDESANERMHMLVALRWWVDAFGKRPGFFMRFLALVIQGGFWNFLFVSYLINPTFVHRLVGHLEESAVYTYTSIISHLEDENDTALHAWGKQTAPKIATDYWKLKPTATNLEVMYQIRADEDNHKKVNHTFADIGPKSLNPFVDETYSHKLMEKQIHDQAEEAAHTNASFVASSNKSSSAATSFDWDVPATANKPVVDSTKKPEPKSHEKKPQAHAAPAAAAPKKTEVDEVSLRSAARPDKDNLFSASVSSVSVSKKE